MLKRFIVAVVVSTLACGGVARAADPSPEVEELFRLAIQRAKENKFDKAADAINAILEIDEENVDAWVYGAWLLNEMKQYPQAATAAAKALKLNPNHSTAWRERGYALMNTNKVRESLVALLTAIDKNKHNWAAYDYLAEAFDKKGDAKSAQEIRVLKASEKEKAERSKTERAQKRID